MSRGTILHIFGWDKKFVLPFRDLIHEHFDDGRHNFIIYGIIKQDEIPSSADTVIFRRLQKNIYALSKAMNRAEKIILHGLSSHLRYILALQPWLLKKCYWVIWGGDLYAHLTNNRNLRWKKNEFFRRLIIRRLGHLITHIEGDVELARQWYGATGQYHECLIYPSNLYREYQIEKEPHHTTNILIGNSAYPSNNHLEILEKLLPFKDQDIAIYAPLSYGKKDYAASIIQAGKEKFGNKFKPLTDFIPFDQYLMLLGNIDIAIFNHHRQQGMGNTISLLGLGKKVFIREDVTPWKTFNQLGVKLYSTSNIDLSPIDPSIKERNQRIIKHRFSEQALLSQLRDIFEE